MARAPGKFQHVPRKGVTLGFGYLLPKPLRNNYRQELWDMKSKSNLIYFTDGATDVSKGGFMAGGGDWRGDLVPSPNVNNVMYLGRGGLGVIYIRMSRSLSRRDQGPGPYARSGTLVFFIL